MEITAELREFLVKTFNMSNGLNDNQVVTFIKEKMDAGFLDVKTLRANAGPKFNLKSVLKEAITEIQQGDAGPSATDLLGGGGIRVKKPSEMYCKDHKPGLHVKTGASVTLAGRPLYSPSELQLAKIGVFAKHMLASSRKTLVDWGMSVPELRDHERLLLKELYTDDPFCGHKENGKWVDRATIEEAGLNVKALLDDATSGGQALVPYEFDQAIITYPLLHSEILPFIEMRESQSSEVKTASVDNVAVHWGTPENTEIPLFDTAGMVAGVDVPIFPVAASIEYGKDFEADTPIVEFGAILQGLFGEAMLKELDDVVCNGNGTNRPEGFLVASGTNGLNSDNNTTGPPTLNDYSKLQFGVAKQYRRADLNPAYVSNDTSYQRSRQLKVDPASPSTDQRLLLGMDLQSYETLGFPHKIQNSISNNKIAYICLKKYRMYRRAGFDFFLTDQGMTLARANKKLLVVRGRYGGILTDANACAIISDAQN